MEKIAQEKGPSEHVNRIPHGGLIQSIPGTPGGGNRMITQDEFWPLWATFFNDNDVVVGEIGTSSFGLFDVKFPNGADFLTQTLWGSIGWATGQDVNSTGTACTDEALDLVGATLGAALVAREQGRRCILFTGDGSIQLTVQEISTMIRHGLKPIIVVLNNDGLVR
jgi:pyruvate decarboxylase